MNNWYAKWVLTTAIALALTACVTINIYFPAAAAEKAADKIIDEVWQIDPNKPSSSNPADVLPEQPASPAPAK